jgi:modulator of FtsH protease HflC
MKKNSNVILIIAGILFFLIVIGNPFYILYEGRQAVITQFGDPVKKPVTKAGLHVKLPFVHKVNYFEKRILKWDGYPTQIPTKDKRYIWIDTTARWRIVDPLKFFKSVYDERGAQSRLDDIIDAAVRDSLTAENLIEIVRSSNRFLEEIEKEKLEIKKEFTEEKALDEIKMGREDIRKGLLKNARETTSEYGIELIDVRIKRVNYVDEVREKVYDRMIAERKRAAETYRSEGRGESAQIKGKMERELKEIMSGAYKKAQIIKGEAEGKATAIYAAEYNKAPDFFAFLKTLETYKNTVDKDTTVILSTDSEYYRYLQESLLK